jgi:hypothetical protein
MWRRVDLVWTDVSEGRIPSIFRVEKSASEEPAWAGGCKMQSARSTRSHIPEDGILITYGVNPKAKYWFGPVDMLCIL